MRKSNLFESILLEADKSRFIKPLFVPDVLDDSEFRDSSGKDYDYLLDDLNTDDAGLCKYVIDWVTSGAAGRFKIDWNQHDQVKLLKSIIKSFYEYRISGGSNKEKRESMKENPIELFLNSGFKIAYEGEDCSGKDILVLPSLENKDFLFVSPLNYESSKWMNSFDCGGQGAKWCIGWQATRFHWSEYVESAGDLFIMAFSKKEFIEQEGGQKLKYMIELSHESKDTKAWLQEDIPEECIQIRQLKEFFGHDANEFINVMIENALPYDTDYSKKKHLWVDGIEKNIYSEDDLIDNHVKLSDLKSGKVKIEQLISAWHDEIYIDCQGDKLSLKDFGIKPPESKGLFNSLLHHDEDFYLSSFINWLTSKGFYKKTMFMHILNASIHKFYWDPDKIKDHFVPDTTFSDCTIDDLYHDDHQSQIALSKIKFDPAAPSTVGTIHYGSSLGDKNYNFNTIVKAGLQCDSEKYKK